jgi:hypothetical protein
MGSEHADWGSDHGNQPVVIGELWQVPHDPISILRILTSPRNQRVEMGTASNDRVMVIRVLSPEVSGLPMASC